MYLVELASRVQRRGMQTFLRGRVSFLFFRVAVGLRGGCFISIFGKRQIPSDDRYRPLRRQDYMVRRGM